MPLTQIMLLDEIVFYDSQLLYVCSHCALLDSYWHWDESYPGGAWWGRQCSAQATLPEAVTIASTVFGSSWAKLEESYLFSSQILSS